MSSLVYEMRHTICLYKTKCPGSITHYRTQTSKAAWIEVHISTRSVALYLKCLGSVTLSRTVQSVSGAAGQSSTHQHTPVAPHRHLIDTRVILEAKTQILVLCSLYDGLISVTVIQRL